MLWIMIVTAIAAGVANPFQSGTNAELNKQLSQPALAGLWVYASGLLALLLMTLAARQFSHTSVARAIAVSAQVPWWAWCGGVISIGSTMAGLVLAQRLGSGLFTGLSVTSALVTSVLLDQFGWIGFKQHAATPVRLVGCGLLIAGVWLVSRS